MSATHTSQDASRASLTSSSIEANRLSRLPTQNAAQFIADDSNNTSYPSHFRRDRRVTSYHHPFQTRCQPSFDSPPSYAVSAHMSRFPPSPRFLDGGQEILPRYTCTAAMEGPMFMRLERISPFQYLPKQEWRDVYVILCGTQLSIHKSKTTDLAGHTLRTAGKLIKRYTLQHAEVGLASDVEYRHLYPATRLSRFIPGPARQKAYERDPSLFRSIVQYVMRLRLETDQILLCAGLEQRLHTWMDSISAGIDVSLAIDERSVPRGCTMPRRRRRQRDPTPENINDQRVIEEQEQILRDLYPSLARSTEEISCPVELSRTETMSDAGDLTLTLTNDQEPEDIDFSALAEDVGSIEDSFLRPAPTRQTTASTMMTTLSFADYQVNPSDLDAAGKWAPPHSRSSGQQLRYIRRCQPVMLYDAPRASNIIMCHGRRLRINNRMDMLEEWELTPPSYDSHSFPAGLDRTNTTSSTLFTTATTISASSIDSVADAQIRETVEATMAPTLQRSNTRTTFDKGHKRACHGVPNSDRSKAPGSPERTLLDEGIVVVGF